MKEIRIGRPGRLLFTAVFVLLLGACSLTIGTSPNAYPFPSEKVFSVRPDVAANITNFYTEPEVVELERNVYSDLQLFTATAVTMVQRELELKDVRMSADAEKTVVLKMVLPKWTRTMWTQSGHVTLQAVFGNGEERSFKADYTTAGNAMRAFNGAILRAVTSLLEDEGFAAYLNE